MGVLNNRWFFSSGSDTPTPPPIEQINQSLRILGGNGTSGTPVLNRPVVSSGSRSWTWSGWCKYSFEMLTLFTPCSSTGASSGLWIASQLWFQNLGTNQADSWRSFGVLRDENAWYHIVFSVDVDNNVTRGYVNGVEAGNANVVNNTYMQFNGTMGFQNGQTNNCSGDGYVADVYLIDGQVLEPTAFGVFDDNGVWCPREVDFTPATMRFSDFVFGTNNQIYGQDSDQRLFLNGFPPENLFNGSIDQPGCNFGTGANGANWGYFKPQDAIEGATQIRVRLRQVQAVRVNGVDQGIVNVDGTPDWRTLTGLPNEITEIAVQGTTNFTPEWLAIEVTDADGTRILTDPFLYSGNSYTAANGSSGFDFTGRDKNFATGVNAITAGFDGNTGTFAFAQADQSINILLNAEGVNSVVVRTDQTQTYSFAINETEVTATRVIDGSGALQTLDLPAGFNGNLTMLSIRGSTTAMTPGFSNIQINGQNLIDGVNNSYGPNGFHLTFADPNDLGHDSSGNGNDFTATGFNTDPVGIFSDDLFTNPGAATPNWNTTDTQFAAPGGAATGAFDGNNSTEAGTLISPNTGTWVIWRPSTPIIANNSVQVTTRFNESIFVNEVDTGLNAPASSGLPGTTVDLSPSLNFPITIESIGLRGNSTGGNASEGRVTNFIIDGIEYVDNTGEDYDLMQDSPSQNYSTINPLNVTGPAFNPNTLSANLQANLTLSQADWASTGGISITEPTYFEGTFVTHCSIGVAEANVNNNSRCNLVAGSGTAYTQDNMGNQSNVDVGLPGTLSSGTIGCRVDPVNRTVAWTYDGATWSNNITYDAVDNPVMPYISAGVAQPSNTDLFINFGQQPFIHAVPNGFNRLQTQNLPSAPIPNGTDHFRALTAPGASILDVARANLNGYFGAAGFTRGLWWIKDMDNSNQHQLLDSVRGGDLTLTCPTLSTDTTYTIPTGDSVAWCWQASDAWSSTDADVTAGTIASSGLRNLDAGFSIVSYQGNLQPGATVGHALGDTPDFIIVKNRDSNTNEWQVRHKDLGGNEWSVRLNSSAQRANFNAWNNQAPDDDVFVLGPVAGSNGSGNDMIAYCWSEVAGYSAFGSYVGNNDADGTFVYTGFKPAFVMMKEITGSASWYIYDTTRNTANPFETANALESDLPNNEATDPPSGTSTVDILSNGFKQRQASGGTNSAQTYIYAAFAENPFGGSNINPTPAALMGPPQIDGIVPGIGKSLRFKGAQSLSRAGALCAESTTFSAWIKFTGEIASSQYITSLSASDGLTVCQLLMNRVGNTFTAENRSTQNATGSASYRDPGAWYHVVYTRGTNATRLFINGVEAPYATQTTGAGGAITASNNPQRIGSVFNASGNFFNGYMADVYFIDGQALDPTAFGEYNDDEVWVPVEDPTIDDYGTNGFKLVMDPAYVDGTTLEDQSGNGNNFTMNGFDIDDYFSADFDFMKDGPTQNYATGNPLMVGIDGGTLIQSFTRANLGWNGMASAGALPYGYASIRIPMGVRVYCEWQATQATTAAIGVSERRPTEDRAWGSAGAWTWSIDTRSWITGPDGTTSTAPGNWTNNPGSIASAEVNTTVTPPTVTFRLNGDEATAETRTFNADFDPENIWFGGNASTDDAVVMNFGQQPFLHQPADTVALQTASLPEATIRNGRDHFRAITGPGDVDGEMWKETTIGNTNPTDPLALSSKLGPWNQTATYNNDGFKSYTVVLTATQDTFTWRLPSGFISQAIMYVSEDGTTWRQFTDDGNYPTNSNWPDLTNFTVDDGTPIKYVRWITAPANASLNCGLQNPNSGDGILGAAQQTFDNGLYIIKSRTNSEQWQYFDTINGETSVPRTPANTAPQTYFDPAGTALAWCWSAPDAFTNADVTAGRRNVAAGFSMVNYTGDGADLRTITHGLDRAPGLIIHFNPAGGDVKVWITGLTGTGRDTQNLVLNTGEVASNQFGAGAIHAPENTTEMIVGRNADPGGTGIAGVNANGALYRAFIWAPIPGYSAFGNFTGAGGPGNDAPFIYTGFKPALVWIQASGEGGGDSFFTADTTCQTFNPYGGDTLINMAQNNGEGTNSARPWDMLSNGFKLRTNSGSVNRTNVVWAAWAENPFGSSNTSPATAR